MFDDEEDEEYIEVVDPISGETRKIKREIEDYWLF